jgi:hypothetical protein
MTMSGENKHNSFFPPEDSPITVPPAEEAWSLMRPMLDKGMPVARVKGSWFRNFRWLAPAAVVAGVSVWLVVRKPLLRDTGRVVEGAGECGERYAEGYGAGRGEWGDDGGGTRGDMLRRLAGIGLAEERGDGRAGGKRKRGRGRGGIGTEARWRERFCKAGRG